MNHLKLFYLLLFSFTAIKGFSQELYPIEKKFILENFTLDNDVVLSHAYIKYVTYGKLNKEKNNSILMPSSYGADYNSYTFMLGNENAIDTNKYFVILTELFANGRSYSPSNATPPFDGPRFTKTSIRDNVRVQFQLINTVFKLTRIKAVIGYSMGAQQAFEWASSYPKMVNSIVAICGTAKTYPHGYARLESAIATLQADANFNNGDYVKQPISGLKAWSLHWATWFLSQEWYRQKKYQQLGNKTVDEFLKKRVEKDTNVDANDRISQAITWQNHDISNNKLWMGNIEKALASINARVLYMPSITDLYFPIKEAEYEKRFLKRVTYLPIPSIWGHLAGAGVNSDDNQFINLQIRKFLSSKEK